MTKNILVVSASPRGDASISKQLTHKVVEKLSVDGATVVNRDVSAGVDVVTGAWIGAVYADGDKSALELSNGLVEELKTADHVVIATPIWNFGVPAALKAWIDQVCRAGLTFEYTAEGPKGLLAGKKATIVVASGGTQAGSEIDFATPYLKHILGFVGITDVQMVAADLLMLDAEASMAKANAAIESLAA
ncbi:MAG: NAD(P)H-dependent oxidoreductase [Pseudomonadota bacterium]